MKTKLFHQSEQGLTLIETTVAMLIFLVFLAFTVPLFYDQRTSTLKNEIDSGAVAVSQQILDDLRQANTAALPSTGSTQFLPSGENIASVEAMGKTYNATITYCAIAGCNSSTRHIKLQIKYNGKPVYAVETTYTQLQ